MRVLGGYRADLEESIQPVALVSDLVANNLFEGFPKHAYGRCVRAAGGVGTNVQCIIQSVPDRGIVYHVTGAWITAPTAGIQMLIGNAVLAANVPATDKAYADARDASLPNALLTTSIPITASLEGRFFTLLNVTGSEAQRWVPLNFVLGELGFLNIANDTANEVLEVNWQWTEYLLEDR